MAAPAVDVELRPGRARAEGELRILSWNLDTVVWAPTWSRLAKAEACVALARREECSLLALQEVHPILVFRLIFFG